MPRDDLRDALTANSNSIPAILESLGVDTSRLPLHGGLMCDPRPSHEEDNPSFSVSRGSEGVWLWNRFGGDGKSGNGYHLLLEFGYTPTEAAKLLKDRAGMTEPFNTRAQSIGKAAKADKLTPNYTSVSPLLFQRLGKAHQNLAALGTLPECLTARGFDSAMCTAYGLGLESDAVSDTLLIPIFRGLEVVQVKQRNPNTDKQRYKYLETGHGSPAWLSPNFTNSDARAVLVVEGEFNAMAAHTALENAGLSFAVQGVAGVQNQPDLEHFKNRDVFVYADGDKAGIEAALKWATLAHQNGATQVKILEPLPDLQDFCDVLGSSGADDLGTWLQNAFITAETFQPEPLENIEEWQEMQPLGERPTVAALPLEMLPEVLQHWLNDAARLACTPLEMLAGNAICALSGVIGSAVTIEARAGFYVTPNLWGAGVMPSGTMKSNQLKHATSPLRTLEQEAASIAAEQNEDQELELSQAQKQLAILEKSFNEKKAQKHGTIPTRDQIKDARQEVRKLENNKPSEKTYVVANTTHEALGILLQVNQKGVTAVRDELAPFIFDMSKEENAEARGFFNAAWDGSLSYTYHRVTREKVKLERVCVAICGMIQPKLLDELIARMLADPMQNDGFLQRFQVLVYPDEYPEWTPPEQQASANPEALERVLNVFKRLDNLERFNPDDSLKPRLMRFSNEAQLEFNQWHDALERKIRPGGELEADTAYKSWYAKSKSLCVSLAAIFHLCNEAAIKPVWGDDLKPINLDALHMAFDWCDYLNEHAKKVYALELQPEQAAAQQVVKLIHDGRINDRNTLREVKRTNKNLPPDLIEQGLTRLKRLGWLRLEEINNGGRPSEVVRLHPDLITEALKSMARKVGGF